MTKRSKRIRGKVTDVRSKPRFKAPICPYCSVRSKLKPGREVFPHRRDLHLKRFYVCPIPACGARVACHANGTRPMGTPARKELRAARQSLHKLFDPIWESGLMTREEAYAWLAKKLGLSGNACHIGLFCEDQIESAREYVQRYLDAA